MIEPEAAPPASRPRRHRRAVLAGVTLLAVVGGGIAVAGGGTGPEAKPLALMAGDGAGRGAERMAMPSAAPALGASADSRSFAPYPGWGWGLKFQVAGDLPALPSHAAAWTVSGPALDQAAVARIAGALGVTGAPVQRDGGWSVDDGGWVLAANPGGDTWSVSYYRSGFGTMTNDAGGAGTGGGAATTGPALSRAEAERRVQDLIDRMGAPGGSWKIETTETEIGIGWACAAPATPIPTDGELTKLEADKLRPLQTPIDGTGASTPAGKPAPDRAMAPCPPPPAPTKGFNVALYPLLDGRRADWPVWSVTLRADGRIENLYGSWATFERGGDYGLRGVDVALNELTAAPEPSTAIREGIAADPAAPESAAGGQGSTGSAPSGLPLDGGVATTSGVATPAVAPACPPVPVPMPMPMPAEKATPLPADTATSSFAPACFAPAPQVVTITGVELGLIQAPVFEDGRVRLHLVPSYRFLGHFDNGTPWETSVVALHPDAIAPPPPDFPVADDGRGVGVGPGVGKAVPPTPAEVTAP